MKKLVRSKPLSVLLVLTLISAAVMLASIFSESFAEAVSLYVSGTVRTALGCIFSLLPFSLSEILIVAGALYIVSYAAAIIFLTVRFIRKRRLSHREKRWIYSPIVFLAALFCLFSFTLLPSYHRRPVSELMGYRQKVTDEDVFSAFEKICSELDASGLDFDSEGSTLSDRDFNTLAADVLESAESYADSHTFLTHSPCRAKPLLLSKPMTPTRITGFYGFFTGECNVIKTYPDFITAYTMAHEYCHAMGIAPENECNFLAFAMLRESSDKYLRYSALCNMLLKLSDDAYRIDPEGYEKLMENIDSGFASEYLAYKRFWKEYENREVEAVSSALNDAYLKSQGQSGVSSYGDVALLVAQYYKNIK